MPPTAVPTGPATAVPIRLAQVFKQARYAVPTLPDPRWGGEVLTQPADLAAVRDVMQAAGIEVEEAVLTMIPKNTVRLEEKDARKTMKIVDALEDSDDVQEVHANFDIPDDVLEALAG